MVADDPRTDLVLPPVLEAAPDDTASSFRLIGQSSYLWFAPGDTTLIVAFDNLATLDNPYPRTPWIAHHVAEQGFALLGVQSGAKDWFRGTDAPDLLRKLADGGFFDLFDRIVFIGASMGGFAAINYAPLVPRATVLALSPQSTMNQAIAPFEDRFPWAVRNSDWSDPAYLDAADAILDVPQATIVFDPLDPIDKAHALRLTAPHVQLAPIPNSTHEAVRTVMKAGAFPAMLTDFAQNGRLGPVFWTAMRKRRHVRKWARALVDNLAASHHTTLALAAYDHLIAQDNYLFAMQARRALLEARPELGKSDPQ